VKKMSEIKRIVELYKVQGSIRQVSKQLGMSGSDLLSMSVYFSPV